DTPRQSPQAGKPPSAAKGKRCGNPRDLCRHLRSWKAGTAEEGRADRVGPENAVRLGVPQPGRVGAGRQRGKSPIAKIGLSSARFFHRSQGIPSNRMPKRRWPVTNVVNKVLIKAAAGRVHAGRAFVPRQPRINLNLATT